MITEIHQVLCWCAADTHLPSGFRGSSSVVEDLHGHHLFGRLIQAFGHLTEDAAAHQLQHAVLTRIAGENIADYKWDGEKKTLRSCQQLPNLPVSLRDTQWWNLITQKTKAKYKQFIIRLIYWFRFCDFSHINNNNYLNNGHNTFNLKLF